MTALPDSAATGGGPADGRAPLGWFWFILLLVVAVGLGVFLVTRGSQPREPKTIELVVPAGTADRLAAGEKVVIMPARLEFTVGDRLRIRNEDDEDQSVGPYEVAAGQEIILDFGKPGMYEGYCPVSEGERYLIVVKAA